MKMPRDIGELKDGIFKPYCLLVGGGWSHVVLFRIWINYVMGIG